MLRRYLPQFVAVAVLALVIAVGVSLHHATQYQGRCITRFGVPLTSATGTNYFDVQQTVAAGELARAERGPLFVNAARATGLSATTLAGETTITPGPLDTYFQVSVTDRRAGRAADSATELCKELGAALSSQRSEERAADAKQVHTQLEALFSQRAQLPPGSTGLPPSSGGSSIDNATQAALQHLGQTLALPNDLVATTRSGPAQRESSARLRRNLEVAAGAIPLTWFLLVLLGESVRRPERPVAS